MAATRCRRAPEDAATPTGGRIGPNAVLQLLPLIAAAGGPAAVTRVLQVAEIAAAPADHGEAGVRRTKLMPADQIVEHLLATILVDLAPPPGARVALLVNGLGGSPPMELAIVAR